MPVKSLPPADRLTRTMGNFFNSPPGSVPVVQEQKVLTPAPPYSAGGRKRNKTTKKAASFSESMHKAHPWAIPLEDPDEVPFSAFVTVEELPGSIDFIVHTNGSVLQLFTGEDLLDIDIEKISFPEDDGTCYLCRMPKWVREIMIWEPRITCAQMRWRK